MNTELSLATSIPRSAGRSARNRGIIARTPWDTSSGFAVAWQITPTEMASRPLSRTPLPSSPPLPAPRHIPEAHGKAVDGADHDGAELRRRAQIGLRGDAELALLRFDAASGQSQVAAADRVLHIPGVEPVSGQASGVEP